MSTPYRIEYKGIISIANYADWYPRDILQEVIPYDLKLISNNKDKWLANLALEQSDYYGNKIDAYGECPAEYSYIVKLNKNEEYEVTIYNFSIKIAMVNLKQLAQMPIEKYDIMLDEIQYSCECIDIETKDMIESYGHEIYIEVNKLL